MRATKLVKLIAGLAITPLLALAPVALSSAHAAGVAAPTKGNATIYSITFDPNMNLHMVNAPFYTTKAVDGLATGVTNLSKEPVTILFDEFMIKNGKWDKTVLANQTRVFQPLPASCYAVPARADWAKPSSQIWSTNCIKPLIGRDPKNPDNTKNITWLARISEAYFPAKPTTSTTAKKTTTTSTPKKPTTTVPKTTTTIATTTTSTSIPPLNGHGYFTNEPTPFTFKETLTAGPKGSVCVSNATGTADNGNTLQLNLQAVDGSAMVDAAGQNTVALSLPSTSGTCWTVKPAQQFGMVLTSTDQTSGAATTAARGTGTFDITIS